MRYLILYFLLFAKFCTAIVSTHGYLPKSATYVGNKAEYIQKVYGDPAFKDGGNWYYVKIELSQNNFGIRKRYSAETIKLAFDKEMVCTKCKKYQVKQRKPFKEFQNSEQQEEKLSLSQKIKQAFNGVAPSL